MKLERTATGIRLTLGTTVREVAIPSPAHVAITRVGSYWMIWVNGILADSFILNYIVPRRPVTIGPVNTVLDEIRITPEALYTAPFTPPTVPHRAWYQGNPTFAKGRIVRNLKFTEGQIAGSEGTPVQQLHSRTSWVSQLYTGQGDRLPPYTGWNPADIIRLMEALGVPNTEENLNRVQERLNQIQAISPEGRKRIQRLLAHRDGLRLELTRTLVPLSTLYRIEEDTGKRERARSSPWKNRYRSKVIYRKLRLVRKQIEVATGIPYRLR